MSGRTWLRRLEELTRPVDPERARALESLWASLPNAVRTPEQALGRAGVGCEATHGVFPRCNFGCTPCYHSRDANRVRVDGLHTIVEIERQMSYLRAVHGPSGHTQLIGGEVSLLHPEDHAEALAIMRRHGREPMSFTHGDFDYEYLRRLALRPDGRPRFARLSFAAHFDITMVGRRGIPRAATERELNPYRERFCAMFHRLRREHGIRFYLAHNMTVTPANVDQIPDVIADCHRMGWSMFSFQPAAYVGDERRWGKRYRELTADAVWERIEHGAGGRLPHRVVQVGDPRCNRSAWGFYLGDRWHSLLDPDDERDLDLRDAFFRDLGGFDFNAPPQLLLPRLTRALLAHPGLPPKVFAWVFRTLRRVGGVSALRQGPPVPMTFVMHRFMDADDVRTAWELLQRGEIVRDGRIGETQERLRACSYAMAHPESGELVPACVQHGVLDPTENRALCVMLPLTAVRAQEGRDGSARRTEETPPSDGALGKPSVSCTGHVVADGGATRCVQPQVPDRTPHRAGHAPGPIPPSGARRCGPHATRATCLPLRSPARARRPLPAPRSSDYRCQRRRWRSRAPS